ncbi:alpha/beta fold hydrolase [Actinoplanes sp. M2I2]|uniref:alpha/beta fold hydrolase n=1 Tax=Actinoplanes sp. M2I2 TaxID=1734444 RepID=UPI0020200624|nr:alpha/beta hydrolase [Actinoplanes sp. M2I2]
MTEYDVAPSPSMQVVHDGPRQAPPLLLIHGSGAAGASWNLLMPALAGRHHVIRVDLPGHGRSPAAPSYEVTAQADRVARVLDDLGLRDVAVAGHSSGGWIGTALAERRPELVRSLTLISSGTSVDALLPQPLVIRLLLSPPLGPLLWSIRSDGLIRRAAAATAVRPVRIPDDMVAALRNVTYRTMRTVLRRNTEYLAERDLPERVDALEVPVLVICGDADPRWDPASVSRYATVPGVRVAVLPGVGHLSILEAPDAVGRLLLDFTAAGRV